MIEKQRRPGPRKPAYGIPSSEWPNELHRVIDDQEPLRQVADDYHVSYEMVRRVILATRKSWTA